MTAPPRAQEGGAKASAEAAAGSSRDGNGRRGRREGTEFRFVYVEYEVPALHYDLTIKGIPRQGKSQV